MPDFEEIKQQAEGHSKEVDEGIEKAEQFADKETGGKDEGLVDKAGSEAERAVGGGQQGANQQGGNQQ